MKKLVSLFPLIKIAHMVSSYSFLKKLIQIMISIFPNLLSRDYVDNVIKFMKEAISDIDKLIYNGKQFLFKIAYEL